MSSRNTPYRADYVGSLLRRDNIKQAGQVPLVDNLISAEELAEQYGVK